MKHAGSDALDLLEPLIANVRRFSRLKERKRGLFYLKGKSFLHFHEDRAGLFADISHEGQNWRMRVSDKAEQRALIAMIRDLLATDPA